MFVSWARVVAQTEMYLTVLEEEDVWAAHGDVEGIALRRTVRACSREYGEAGVAHYHGTALRGVPQVVVC